MKEKIVSIWNHLLIVLSLTFLVFLVLHYYNARMGFLTNRLSVGLLGIFCLLTIANSVSFLVGKARQRKRGRKKEEKGGDE